MRRNSLIFFLVAVSCAIAGCKFERGVVGSGVRKSEKRDLKSFNAIDTGGAYDVDITCQKPASFEIEADDNLLPLIKTEVRDGVLYVTSERQFHTSKSPFLRITLPDLNSVTTNGAGDVKIADANSNDLTIKSTGAASINAAGKAKSVTISSNGAGSINASGLMAEKAKVDISGAAKVDVYASDQLDVTLSGVGNVNYSGNPKVVNKHVSGFGSVNPKN